MEGEDGTHVEVIDVGDETVDDVKLLDASHAGDGGIYEEPVDNLEVCEGLGVGKGARLLGVLPWSSKSRTLSDLMAL